MLSEVLFLLFLLSSCFQALLFEFTTSVAREIFVDLREITNPRDSLRSVHK